MPDWLVSIGVNALLTIVANQKDRKKWARALAKVFVAIQQAAQQDAFLSDAIRVKQEG